DPEGDARDIAQSARGDVGPRDCRVHPPQSELGIGEQGRAAGVDGPRLGRLREHVISLAALNRVREESAEWAHGGEGWSLNMYVAQSCTPLGGTSMRTLVPFASALSQLC